VSELCEVIHQAWTAPEAVVLAPHDVDLDECGPSGELLAWLRAPRGRANGVDVVYGRLGRAPVIASVSGPGGSGRYWTVHLVQTEGHACVLGTTLAWRGLFPAVEVMKRQGLLPLPSLADVDGDGELELIQFRSVPRYEDDSIGSLALPALHWTGDRWVPDLPASRVLAAKLAEVYASLADAASFQQVIHALRTLSEGQPCR
jgi:hypothetical protein